MIHTIQMHLGRSSMATFRDNWPYTGVITREKFLFNEMRLTAQLQLKGMTDEQIIEKVVSENLYQYPTNRMLRGMARTCLKRLVALGDTNLVSALAKAPVEVAKQIDLYAMMCQYHLVWDFMITVIGEKYRTNNLTYGHIDLNVFINSLQEQHENVAKWSDSTIKRIKRELNHLLIENDYLDSSKSTKLNPVIISPVLEKAIKDNGDKVALIAFNCFD